MDITTITDLLTTYGRPAVFTGAFFFAESFIIAAALLASQHIWSMLDVFVLAYIGTILADIVWFYFGVKIMHFINRWKVADDLNGRLVLGIEKIVGARPFLILLIIKYLYGTRFLTVFYLSSKDGSQEMKFSRFFWYNALATLVWLTSLLGAGYLIGFGAGFIENVEQFGVYALVMLVLVAGFRWLINRFRKKLITKKS